VWDAAAAAALAAVALLPALRAYGVVLGELPTVPSDALHLVLVFAQTLPLAARRRAPAAVLAVVGLAFALDQALAYPPSPAGLGVLVALYSAGAHQRRSRAITVSVAAVAYIALAVVLTQLGSRERPWEFATFALVLAAAWAAGDIVRLRAASALAAAERRARDAVTHERARLARELHDVVSHHVTGMVVQADAAAFVASDDSPLRQQWESIAAGGRRALTDLRGLLDVLGTDAATSPSIGPLHDLVDDARRRGQHVTLHEEGTPTGPDELRLAVHRLVQEALTNALKHSPGGATDIAVRWGEVEVHARIVTRPATLPVPRRVVPGSGRGLAGLRERVRRLGGTLHAGPEPDGRFVMEASIPVADAPARDTPPAAARRPA